MAALPPRRTWVFSRKPPAHAGAELQAHIRLACWERPPGDKHCCCPASHGTGKGSWGWAGPPHPLLLHLKGLVELRLPAVTTLQKEAERGSRPLV